MHIIRINHIEDCFDGSLIKEVEFNELISEKVVFTLGQKGDLKYYRTFERPFFKVIFENGFYLKGVVGNKTARLFLKNKDNLKQFVELIKKEVPME